MKKTINKKVLILTALITVFTVIMPFFAIKNTFADSNITINLNNFKNANYFDITKLSFPQVNNVEIEKTNGVPYSNITIYTNENYNEMGFIPTNNKIKDVAPQIEIGQTYYLNADTTTTIKSIYLGTAGIYWDFGSPKLITPEIYESTFNFYTNSYTVGTGKNYINNISISRYGAEYQPNFEVLINAGYNEGFTDGATEYGFNETYGENYYLADNYINNQGEYNEEISINIANKNLIFNSNTSYGTGLYFFNTVNFANESKTVYINTGTITNPATLNYEIEIGTARQGSMTTGLIKNQALWSTYNNNTNENKIGKSIINIPVTGYLYLEIKFKGSTQANNQYNLTLENIVFSNNEIFEEFYNNGYNKGYDTGKKDNITSTNEEIQKKYTEGYNEGKKEGFEKGIAQGKATGYNEGIAAANKYTFLGLVSAVVDAPLKALTSFFNFDLLGFNMAGLIQALFTLFVILTILRLIMG